MRRIDVLRIEAGDRRGTGFLVAPDQLLTALHVVGAVVDGCFVAHGEIVAHAAVAERGQLRVETRRLDEAALIDCDPVLDWACFRIEPVAGVAPFELAEPAAHEAWSTYGFPDSAPSDGKATTGHVVSIGAALALAGAPHAVVQLYSLEAGAGAGGRVHGYSGAPVVVHGCAVALVIAAAVRGTAEPVDPGTRKRSEEGTLYGVPLAPLARRLGLGIRGELPPIASDVGYPSAPYRGLARYERGDARVLFGRDRDVREILAAIERPAHGLVLLTGQAGAGKSSILEAGVRPRLEARCDVRLVRVEGDLRAAWRRATGGDWLAAEGDRPLVVVLDQLETGLGDDGEAIGAWIRGDLAACLDGGRWRPRGTLVLSFRKEWAAEVQQALALHGAPEWRSIHLAPLDRAQITQVVHAVEQLPRYQVTVEPGLGARIADVLCADPDAPRAPTLQVWLTELHRQAPGPARRLTRAGFEQLVRDGATLGDFLDRQLQALSRDAYASGLGLDLLDFHVGPLVTAIARSHAERAAAYADARALDAAVEAAIDALEAGGLIVPLADRAGYRLIHDTLAPVVRARVATSSWPAQRARVILDGYRSEWQRGVPVADARGRLAPLIDESLLAIVERGRPAMRRFGADEAALVAASRRTVDTEAIGRAWRERGAADALAGLVACDPGARSPSLEHLAIQASGHPYLQPLGGGPAWASALSADGDTFVLATEDELWVVAPRAPATAYRIPGLHRALHAAVSREGGWVVLGHPTALCAIELRTGARHGFDGGIAPLDRVWISDRGEIFVVAETVITGFAPGQSGARWRAPLEDELGLRDLCALSGGATHLVWRVIRRETQKVHWLAADGTAGAHSFPRRDAVAISPRAAELVFHSHGVLGCLELATGVLDRIGEIAGNDEDRPRAVRIAIGDAVYSASQHADQVALHRNGEALATLALRPGEVLTGLAAGTGEIVVATSTRLIWRQGDHHGEVETPLSLDREPRELAVCDGLVLVGAGTFGRLVVADLRAGTRTEVAIDVTAAVGSRGAASFLAGGQPFVVGRGLGVRAAFTTQPLATEATGWLQLAGDAVVRCEAGGVLSRVAAQPTPIATVPLDAGEDVASVARSADAWFARTSRHRVHGFGRDGAPLGFRCLPPPDRPLFWAFRLAASPDGRWLTASPRHARSDQPLHLWWIADGPPERPAIVLEAADLETIGPDHAFSEDGRWLAAASLGGSVAIWELGRAPTRTRTIVAPVPHPVHTLGFRPDHQLVIVWQGAQVARVDPRTGVLTDTAHWSGAARVALSPDARWGVVTVDGKQLRLFSTDDLATSHALPGPRGAGPVALDNHARRLIYARDGRHWLAPIDPCGPELDPIDLGVLAEHWLSPDGDRLITLASKRATWWRLDALQALHEQLICER